jgi:hypothetical protein
VRVLLLGASQKGKTTFAQRLCAALADRGAGGAIVVFDQKFPDLLQYDGQVVTDLQALYNALADHVPAVICRAPLTAEQAATAVRACAETGDRATLLVDEPRPILKINESTGERMERVFVGPSLIWLCEEGGGLGGSYVQLCQMPRLMPESLKTNLTATVSFGLGGGSLEYAVDMKLLPRAAAETVSRLPVGRCCVFLPDQDWDGLTYGPN